MGTVIEDKKGMVFPAEVLKLSTKGFYVVIMSGFIAVLEEFNPYPRLFYAIGIILRNLRIL
jgi:hypothetical protein